jgi:large subunit ribosomal protein L30
MSEEVKEISKESKPVTPKSSAKYAVIRVRGLVRLNGKINDTMKMMHLHRKNYCSLIDKKNLGMIKKTKDYVTYGEIDKETEALLIKEKQEKGMDKEGKEVIKPFFRLCPPRKGFGRKGIKIAFSKSGALGYRGAKINDLIKRML